MNGYIGINGDLAPDFNTIIKDHHFNLQFVHDLRISEGAVAFS
jgi:hypothetical protein